MYLDPAEDGGEAVLDLSPKGETAITQSRRQTRTIAPAMSCGPNLLPKYQPKRADDNSQPVDSDAWRRYVSVLYHVAPDDAEELAALPSPDDVDIVPLSLLRRDGNPIEANGGRAERCTCVNRNNFMTSFNVQYACWEGLEPAAAPQRKPTRLLPRRARHRSSAAHRWTRPYDSLRPPTKRLKWLFLDRGSPFPATRGRR